MNLYLLNGVPLVEVAPVDCMYMYVLHAHSLLLLEKCIAFRLFAVVVLEFSQCKELPTGWPLRSLKGRFTPTELTFGMHT